MSLRLVVQRPHTSYDSMRNVPVSVKFNNWKHAKEGTIKRVAHECDRFYYYDSKGNEHWRLVFFGYDPLDVSVVRGGDHLVGVEIPEHIG